MTLYRFAFDDCIHGAPIAEITGVARIERRPTGHFRVTSIVLDVLRSNHGFVLPHTHPRHGQIASWLVTERRDDIEETLRRHEVARQLMRIA